MKSAQIAACADGTKFFLNTTGTREGVAGNAGLVNITTGLTAHAQRTAAMLIGLGAQVTVASAGGTRSVRFVQNGIVVMSISVPGSTTGWLSTSGSVAIAAGDTTWQRIVTTLLAQLTVTSIVAVFDREGGTFQRFAAVNLGNIYLQSPYYMALAANNEGVQTLNRGMVEFVVGADGDFAALQCYLSSNDRGGCTFAFYKNGVRVLSATTPTTGTGLFEAGGSVHVVRGDRVCLYLEGLPLGGGANNITAEYLSIEWNGQRHFFSVFSCAAPLLAPASPSYIPAGGATGTTQAAVAAEAGVKTRMMFDCRAIRLHAQVPESLGPPADDTVTLRVNAADSPLLLTIPTGQDGVFEQNDGSKAAIIKAADDVDLKLGTVNLTISLTGLTLREDINVNGQIRSPIERPPRRRLGSRIFNAAFPVPNPIPIIARMIKSHVKRKGRKGCGVRGEGRGARRGPSPGPGAGVGVVAGPSLVRRHATFRTSFNIFGAPSPDSIYRFYHTVGSPPLEGDTPFATSPTLEGFSPPDVFADGAHYFSVSKFNGLIDSGFLPVGPNGETYIRIDVVGGVESALPPNAPLSVRLEKIAGGVVRIHATYSQTDALRATEWAIGFTSNGIDPVEDVPTTTKAMGEGVLDVLEHDIGPFAHGLTIKVRVQTRRGGTVYSDGSTVLSVTADALGPVGPSDSDSIPG